MLVDRMFASLVLITCLEKVAAGSIAQGACGALTRPDWSRPYRELSTSIEKIEQNIGASDASGSFSHMGFVALAPLASLTGAFPVRRASQAEGRDSGRR